MRVGRSPWVFAMAAAIVAVVGVVAGLAAPRNEKRPVKEFSISIAEVEHELYPGGPKVQAWGFNGQVPGPVMRVTEGDLVRVKFTNNHTSNHTLHFHGMNLTNNMDGVAYGHLGHLEVKPGESYTYEFVADPPGTHMYHCHVNSPQHIDMGMVGVLVVEPKNKRAEPKVDREHVLLLDDWYLNESGNHEPMAHPAMISQANYFTVNGKAFPGVEPIKMTPGETIRIRLVNVGYQAHSMHLHGHSFTVTHRDGRPLKVKQEQDSLLIGPGERYDLVVTGDKPGLWLFHCHVVPHVTNDGQYPGGLLIPVVTTAAKANTGTPHVTH